MEKPTPEEANEIQWRILNAKADCALRMVHRVIGYLLEADIPIPTMQILARSTVSGKANDPAAQYALALYTHDMDEALMKQRECYRMMLEDERAHQAKSSESS